MCSCVLFGYWGMFTWLPAYLSSPVERGGAGLSVIRSSAWIVPLQIGAFFGYFSFGFFADRVGRRAAFLTFVLMTALLVPVYGLLGRNVALLLAIGPLVGFFGHGYFSALGRDGGGTLSCGRAHHRAGLLLQPRPGPGRARARDGGCAGRPQRHRRRAGFHVDIFRGRRRC